MKRCVPALVFASVLAVACGVNGQETYKIKLKERGDGHAAVVKKTETTASKVTVTDAGGNVVVDQKEVKTEIQEYSETILKREAGKPPTKFTRDYVVARSGKNDQLEDGPLKGKSVVIEKKEDKYTFTFKDGESVEGEPLAALVKEFSKKSDTDANLEKLVLPPNAVKVGESWKIQMPKVAAELSKDGAMELDGGKSIGEGTLVKTYKKDGIQYGEMKFRLEMPLLTVGKGNEQLKFAAGAKLVMDMMLDACIDGTMESGTMKLKLTMGGNATIPNAPGVTATVNVTLDGTQVQQETKKK